MFPTLAQERPSHNTYWVISALCLSYLIFQLIYIPHTVLAVDEFWFAHHIYKYTYQLPYRDFLPYKTVLGYYLLSVPFFVSHTLLQPLYYIKDEIAIINTLFLCAISMGLARYYHPRAVIFSLLLVLANHLFLTYSVELRVDMFASWLSLISILLILSNRFLLAGIILGIGILFSQKAVWFFVGSNIAFAGYGLILSRRWKTISPIIIFNGAVIVPIAAYLIFWSVQSSMSLVLKNVFYEAYTQSKITWYASIHHICWTMILSNGPLLILLWPLTWIPFFVRPIQDHADYARRFFIALYAATILLLIISYQQAFPYGMVFIIPVCFVLYPDFFSWLIIALKPTTIFRPFNRAALLGFLSLYTIGIMGVMIYMALPYSYYLIALIPLCLGIFLLVPRLSPSLKNAIKQPIVIMLVCTGILYPMVRFVIIADRMNGDYQQSMLIVSNKLLEEGGGFFAGTPLFYDRDQAIPGLKNLIDPAIKYLSHPSRNILPMMLLSLDLEPRTDQQVIHDLKISPVKFYLNNNRIDALPDSIHRYLASEFNHYWGSIYIYAPKVSAKNQTISIKFSGTYRVISKNNSKIYLDHKKTISLSVVTLTKGKHFSKASTEYRLQYVPKKQIELNPKYAGDDWYRAVKIIVM